MKIYSTLQGILPNTSDYSHIGAGSYKDVFKALVSDSGKYETIKLTRVPTEEHLKRILREVDSLKQCDCDHIIKLGTIDYRPVSIDDGIFLIHSEEYLDSGSLRDSLDAEAEPTVAQVIDLAISMLKAVEEMWKNKIIHRDIKPANIMLSADSRNFILIDLGIAFLSDGERLTDDTNPANALSTPAYKPPEMNVRGFRDTFDFRSDLYSLGLVLFEYAAGVHPFYTKEWMSKDFQSLNSYRSDIPEELERIIMSLMRKNSAFRPTRIDKLVSNLEVLK